MINQFGLIIGFPTIFNILLYNRLLFWTDSLGVSDESVVVQRIW